jgi:hypothetical protein
VTLASYGFLAGRVCGREYGFPRVHAVILTPASTGIKDLQLWKRSLAMLMEKSPSLPHSQTICR